MPRIAIILTVVAVLAASGCRTVSTATDAPMPTTRQRIVFLGDSITDGNTYPNLVAQSLAAAGRPVPVVINAGIAGNTAAQMLDRLDKDVLVFEPDLVVFNAGANDAGHNVEPADFAATMAAIAERLDAAGIELMILTTSPNLTRNDEPKARVDAYVALMRDYAAAHEHRLGDANAMLAAAHAAGDRIMEPDGIHPGLPGYRIMAAAVLAGLGHADVPVTQPTYALLPGVITHWQVMGADAPLADIATVAPDASWTEVTVPQTEPIASWWRDAERQRGFADLKLAVGSHKRYVSLTTITATAPREAYLQLGGPVSRLWLNGELLFDDSSWRGWHPGHDRLPIHLRAGENRIIVESGSDLFLALTPDRIWEDD
jgi:lysophospholipase L1-like esterase